MGLEESLAAILGDDGKPVGAGVLVEGGLVLTCAHVVNRALNRGTDPSKPPEAVSLTLYGARNAPLKAKVHGSVDAWGLALEKKRDLCLLQIESASLGAAKPAVLASFDPRYRFFTAAGFPDAWRGEFAIAEGRVVGLDDALGMYLLRPDAATQIAAQIQKPGIFGDQKAVAGQISPGFSGGPVQVDGLIVGLIAEARPPKEVTGYMIPAAAFPGILSGQIKTFDNQIVKNFPHVESLKNSIEDQQRKMIADITPFDIRLRLFKSFPDLIKSQSIPRNNEVFSPEEGYTPNDLSATDFARCLQKGLDNEGKSLSRVLLHAPGGAGKSHFLMELLWVASDNGLVPFFLDFSRKSQTSEHGESENAAIANPKDQFSDWFNGRAFGSVEGLFALAKNSSADAKPLLVVDGFNQAPINLQNVLKRIEDIANQDLAGAVIIVADRMVDRNPESQFRRAIIPPLAPAVYASALKEKPGAAVLAVPSWYPILSSPLFLNKFLHMSGTAEATADKTVPSRFSILNQYFRDEQGCNFTPKEMLALCELAYEAYRRFGGTAIPRNKMNELLYQNPAVKLSKDEAESLEEKITKQGLIQDIGEKDCQFQHQILHDHLAALKVASSTEQEEEKLLRAPAFDVLSLNGASSDAIELAVEALQCPDQLLGVRDKALTPWAFLTEVYDWNYWITLQCVASLDRRGDSTLRPWMRHAIYALNLEKKFDPFLHTAIRAERLREQVPQTLPYLKSETAEDLRTKLQQALVADKGTDATGAPDSEQKAFEAWQAMYFRAPALSREELKPIWGDPVLSWTTANVIRRLGADKSVTEELMRLYEISKATSDAVARAAGFRWRIVHSLGRAQPQASELLIDISFDSVENFHVRYGAIRSLIELTVTNIDLQDQASVFGRVRERLKDLFPLVPTPNAAAIRQQLRRTCAFNEPYVSGRVNWLEDWISSGLPEYEKILEEGRNLATKSGLSVEADLWKQWVEAANQAKSSKNWPLRQKVWQAMIEKEP